jgi:hypothetical protein
MVPLRLNFQPQFATILRKAVLRHNNLPSITRKIQIIKSSIATLGWAHQLGKMARSGDRQTVI